MLLQIRDYIKREQVVSTQQLSREFNIDEQALQPMLAIWESKGTIQQCHQQTTCQSSCFKCKTTQPVFYSYNTPNKS